MAYLKRRAMLDRQADFFERLHIDFWQGEGGAVFATNCEHRFEDLFLEKQKPDLQQLRLIWKQQRPKHIVEFGCNSGLLLQYMTSELSGVLSSTGIEINAEQVRQNRRRPSSIHASTSFMRTEASGCLIMGKPRPFLYPTAESLSTSDANVWMKCCLTSVVVLGQPFSSPWNPLPTITTGAKQQRQFRLAKSFRSPTTIRTCSSPMDFKSCTSVPLILTLGG